MHLWKMLDFSALLSKDLYALVQTVFWRLNYGLYVVFYVDFAIFVKKLTLKIDQLKIKSIVQLIFLLRSIPLTQKIMFFRFFHLSLYGIV